VDLKETIMPAGYVHYARIDCNDCGKFVKWAKKPEKQIMQKINKYTGGYGDMNNVSLVGRLTKDVDMRYTAANNTAVAGFTLAVNRRIKAEGQPDADFIPVVAWQKTAEFCSKYFRKGQQVWINGRIQTRNWDDTDGKKHYVTEIIAEEVGFADSKKDDGTGSNSGNQQQSPPPQQQNDSNPSPSNPLPAAVNMPWEKQ
jgi:single-strand DNA-binding protein